MNIGVIYNVGMMYIISEIVANERFRHSVLPVMLFDTDEKTVFKQIPELQEIIKHSGIVIKDQIMYCLVT